MSSAGALPASAPSVLTLLGEHWSLSPGACALAIIPMALYGGAMARVAASAPRRRWPLARACSFACGVLVLAVALQSGIGAYDARMLSAHMLEHLLLLLVAPLLLLGGHPLVLALRALGPSGRASLLALVGRARALSSAPACVATFSVALLVLHLPAVFDAAVAHPPLHAAEHGLLLALGLLFWSPLVGADPAPRRRLGGLGKVLYLLASMPAMALVGAYLDRAPSLVYGAYARPARALGISAVADQQQAGAIMWVAGSSFMIAVGLLLAMRALLEEERRQSTRELRAGGERIARPAPMTRGDTAIAPPTSIAPPGP